MTDKYFALTVALMDNVREDDAEPIIEAIRMIKGVLAVDAYVADPALYTAHLRVRRDMTDRLLKALDDN